MKIDDRSTLCPAMYGVVVLLVMLWSVYADEVYASCECCAVGVVVIAPPSSAPRLVTLSARDGAPAKETNLAATSVAGLAAFRASCLLQQRFVAVSNQCSFSSRNIG